MNTVTTVHNYSYIFDFEDQFIHEKVTQWLTNNWTSSFYVISVYLVFLLFGSRYMKNRPRFELRRSLIVWNTCLATFSILGTCRTLPEFFHVLQYYGLYHSICIPSFITLDKVSGFWSWLFTLSKLPELGDTVFIVLRKQRLMFLHWYHHVIVLFYAWFTYKDYTSSGRWFIAMNYPIHSVMYSYYAVRSMGFVPPKLCAILITTLQLLQMIIGCAVNIWAYNYIQTHSSSSCSVSINNIRFSLVMYFSFLILFTRFFYQAYISTTKIKKINSKEENITNDFYNKSKIQ